MKSENLKIIKSLGLKATTQRARILEIFQNSQQRHMGADDVFRILSQENSGIGLATVYRVLTQFVEVGLLERQQFESEKSVYELKSGQHHDHLVCAKCGHVEEFYDESIERRQQKIAKEHGFAIQEHSLNLYVDCLDEACTRRKDQEQR